MKNSKRAERRSHTRRKQKERGRKLRWLKSASHPERAVGKTKKHNYGCGCTGCKPWKHGLESKFTVAERRKLQDEE